MKGYLIGHNFDVDIFQYTKNKITDGFLQKIESGHYTLSQFPCPICGNVSEWELVGESTEGFTWAICKECGLLQNNVRLNNECLDEFYESGEYVDMCSGNIDSDDQFKWNYRASAIIHLDIFHRICADIANIKVLDVGCGAGAFLLAMRDEGAQVKGFDLDKKKIDFGKKYISEIEYGNAMDVAVDFSDFNYVTVLGVLEHLFNPAEFMRNMSQKVDGTVRIVISVPNLEHCHAYSSVSFLKYLQIAHLWYFTSISLERLLNNAGFEVEYFLPSILDITVVCKKANGKVSNLNNSFALTVMSVNYCNFQCDPNNSYRRSIKAREAIFKEIYKRQPIYRRVGGGITRRVKQFLSKL